MSGSTHHNMVGVQITIFDIGYVISEDWLSEFGDLWILPKDCDSVWDCVVPQLEKPHIRAVQKSSDGPYHSETYYDHVFKNWAIYFEFNDYCGEEARAGDGFHSLALEYEAREMGDDIYKDCLKDLLAMADDLIDVAIRQRELKWMNKPPPLYSVIFTTLWEVEYYQVGWECPEWDVQFSLLGRVNIGRLAQQMLAEEVPA